MKTSAMMRAFVNILTPRLLTSLDDARTVLRLTIDELGITPDVYSQYEPIKTPFDADNLIMIK